MFVNQKDKLKVLNKEYKSKNATLSVIYGRRRVGKTALISEYIKDKSHIYLYATEENLALQLENFSKDLMKMANLPYMENAKFKILKRHLGFIASNLSVHSSYLPQYINRLIELDFITKEVPITEKNPLKSKLGRYKIKDKFINFCFYYVYKNYNYLEINQTKAVLDEIKTNFNSRFVSFAFEDFIYEQILQNPKKHLGFTPLKLGGWWNNNEEIDLVAMDEQNIAFIECKWQNSVDKTKVLRQLKLKSKCIKHDKNEKFLVFTKEDYLS